MRRLPAGWRDAVLGTSEPEPSGDEPAPAPRGLVRVGAAFCCSGAVALLVAALRTFPTRPASGWPLFAAALALLAGAFLLWPARPENPERRVRAPELALLLAVLALGAAFRLHRIATEPYGVWYDEAQNALETRKIVEDPGYRPVFVAGASQMPALSFYVFSPFVRALGARAVAIRLATAAAGLLAIVFVWLLGRELFSREAGLLGAAFLAVSRWHVDFSRFGTAMVFATLVVPAALWLFARSQRLLSPRAAVLGGIVLGLGMQTYYAMLAVPALVAFAFLARCASRRPPFWRSLALVVLLLDAALVAYAPVLQYARAHRAEFSERMRTVSAVHAGSVGELVVTLVRPSPERAEGWRVLARNAASHARMFHVKGDPNGRHNLPGAPMLDVVTGAFFAIGFLLCLACVADWRSATLLAWFAAMMAAGVLSLDFEAPQAARTCGVTPVVSLMAALPLAYAVRSARRTPGRARFLAVAASGAAVIGAAAALSWRTYFGAQLHDPSVFASFSADATRIAEVVAAEGTDASLFAPPELVDLPVQLLMARGPTGLRPFERGRDLPIAPPGRRAIVFLHGDDAGTLELLRRLYPRATDEPLAATLENGSRAGPILHVVRVPAEDVAAPSGLEVRYVSSSGETAAGRALRTEWDLARAPVAAPFTMAARGALRVAHEGRYAFRLAGPGDPALTVDGEVVPAGPRAPAVALAEGVHELSLRARMPRAAGALRLTWGAVAGPRDVIGPPSLFGPAAAGGGLLGSYFAGPNPQGTPAAFRRIDPQVAFLFHLLPLPRPFSIRWEGSLFAPETGDYRFALSSIDASELRVDGESVVRNRGEPRVLEGAVALARGWHAVDLAYENHSLFAQVTLSWIPPGRPRETVPPLVLRPPAPSGARRAHDAPPP